MCTGALLRPVANTGLLEYEITGAYEPNLSPLKEQHALLPLSLLSSPAMFF